MVQRGPLLRLEAPILFVIASHDKNCSLADLEKMEPNMPSRDKRFIRMQVGRVIGDMSYILCFNTVKCKFLSMLLALL